METPWYTQFFKDDYLRFHTAGLSAELTAHEVDFITRKAALAPGMTILDLCCGHGRVAIELASRGYNVIGQDLSEPSLEKAQADARTAGVSVRWVCSDMRQIAFDAELDACINWFSSFGYLENDEEDLKVLSAVHHALRPGGKFLIDIPNHAWLMRNYLTQGWNETPDGSLVLEDRHFDLLAGRNVIQVTYISPNGERHIARRNVRIYTLVEMIGMLTKVGLKLCDIWGDITGVPYSLSSRRMIVSAEKK